MELGLQVGSLRSRRRPGALDQGGLQPRRPLSHAGGPALAGALVVLGTKSGPGDQMAFGREPRPMSTPISAAMTSALSWLTPGIMLEDCDRRAKGLDVGVRPPGQSRRWRHRWRRCAGAAGAKQSDDA